MRIHTTGRRIHRMLRSKPFRTQGCHQRTGLRFMLHKRKRCHACKVRFKRRCAFAEQRKIHIPVRTIVVPVHQARLWRSLHLQKERILRKRSKAFGRERRKERIRAFHDFRKAVRPAARAGRDGAAAYDAAPLRAPGELLSVRSDHIDVK